MELLEALKGRRSIRSFQQRPVDDATLMEIVRAATFAPSGGNAQPLRYVLVRTEETLERIFKLTAWGAHVRPKRNPVWKKDSPAAFIAICSASKDGALSSTDAGAAIQNMQLAAFDKGLGTCWLGAFDKQAAADILELKDMSCLFLLAVGYPAENPVMETISLGDPTKYHIDGNDLLHVPKYSPEAVAVFR